MARRGSRGRTRSSGRSAGGIPLPIGNAEDYQKALAELRILEQAPLGTKATEGLQDLIDAILTYEAQTGAKDSGAADDPAANGHGANGHDDKAAG